MVLSLTPDRALIFRIVHRDNIPFLLDHGVHCRNSDRLDPHYINIGSADLISKRHNRAVPIPPYGMLSDYVPFYFTPRSPMLLNIKTGYNGVQKRPNEEIVVLVASLRRLKETGRRFVFTDRHAYLAAADFFDDLARLDRIDWAILQRSDFKRDSEDPGKFERYQAEALIYRKLPVEMLLGLVSYDNPTDSRLKMLLAERGMTLRTEIRPQWYF